MTPTVSGHTFTGFIYMFLNTVPRQTMFLEPSNESLFMHAVFFFIIVFHKSKGSTNLNILLHFPPSE